MLDDAEFIERLQQRNQAAWAELFDAIGAETYSFIFHLCSKNQAVAQDLHQELWLECIHNSQKFDESRGSVRAWVFGIAQIRVALFFRRRKLRREQLTCDVDAEPATRQDTASLPEDLLHRMELVDAVRAALVTLHPEERQLLVRKYAHGECVQAIAESLNKSAKSIESALGRAKDKLRIVLRPLGSSSSQEI
jgi:RNA polymerase sigma-70 factor (ECF subfamily)